MILKALMNTPMAGSERSLMTLNSANAVHLITHKSSVPKQMYNGPQKRNYIPIVFGCQAIF